MNYVKTCVYKKGTGNSFIQPSGMIRSKQACDIPIPNAIKRDKRKSCHIVNIR